MMEGHTPEWQKPTANERKAEVVEATKLKRKDRSSDPAVRDEHEWWSEHVTPRGGLRATLAAQIIVDE